jgi:thiamine biosynthesis lipoprotein
MMRIFLLLASALLFTACSQEEETHKRKLLVFGTLVEITITGTERKIADEAVAAISHDFQRMHKDWHAWKPGELFYLNAAFAAGEKRNVSDFLLLLIKQAKQFYQKSDGLFNPAAGAIFAAWGFHSDKLPTGPPPLEKIMEIAAKSPTMDDVIIDTNVVFSRNRAVKLDFGGFAKGAALDVAINSLRKFGIKNAIINAGGDLNVIGSPETGLWNIGIRNPKTRGVIASVRLKSGEVLYTSGNYERYRAVEGIRYSHIIDPRSGMPVSQVISSSVIAKNGALADAAATALSVAGVDRWQEIANRMGVDLVMLIEADGTVHASQSMQKRIE